MRLYRLLAATALSATLLIPVVAQEAAFFRSPLSAPLLMGPGGSTPVDPEDPGVPGGSPNNPDPDPEPLPVSVTLGEHTFAPFIVGDRIDHDFARQLAVANGKASDVTWSVGSPSNLPVGPGLSGSRLYGELEQAGEFDFELVATHPDAEDPARQVYTIVVNGVTLRVTQIAGGTNHTCAVTVSGGAKCWGYNSNGQLGDGTTTQRNTPVQVSGLTSGVTSISAGHSHTCAIRNGSVRCWGNNDNGQLGDGTTTQRTTSVIVSGLNSGGVTSIDAGYSHTCAIHAGAAKCWGDNAAGQLGDGSRDDRNTPVSVSNLGSGVTSIATGHYHACAVHNGAAKCWGNNGNGRLGDGTTTQRSTPVNVSGLGSGVASISGAATHTCAITTSGGAKCWGFNNYGKLGDGTTTDRRTPVNVSGLGSGVTTITMGNSHSCAVHNGAVKCWGSGINGQLGNNNNTQRNTPVAVGGLGSGVKGISAGDFHNCVIYNSGTKCWGNNNTGQLGDGTVIQRHAPVEVNGL
jgi:Alpha-tubulin suppressor and related RCC1 domain-containing proteins